MKQKQLLETSRILEHQALEARRSKVAQDRADNQTALDLHKEQERVEADK